MPEGLTFIEQVRQRASGEKPTFMDRVRLQVAQLPTQEEAQMQQARARLERSPLPGFYAHGVQAGAPIVSGIARLLGQGAYADTMTRTAARIERAQREREAGGPIPDVLQSGLRGAGASLTQMFGAGMVGGPYAAIAAASAFEANRAITEGKDAGKTGTDLAKYALTEGVIEGAPAAFMQKIGLGGIESLVGKRAVVTGTKDALKRFGVQFTAEHVEEQVTEYLHNAWAAFEDVDPEAMNPENIRQTAYETAVQTTIAWGLGHGIAAGRPKDIAEIHREIEAYAKEGKIPSRRVYKRWNLGPGLPGDSISQRRAFIQETGRRLRESEAAPPKAAPEAPGAPVTPIEAEGVLGPEAIQEGVVGPREALVGPGEAQIEPGAVPEAAIPTLDPQEGDDATIALNKAQGNKILEELGTGPLEDAGRRPWPVVAAEVATGKLDEKALDNAVEVLRTRRGGTDTEHVAMVMKAGKLMDERIQVKAELAEAAKRNDSKEFDRLTRKLEGTKVGEFTGTLGIESQIELLARADAYAGTEPARAVSIRRMKLSRENYDVVSVIQDYQAAKGPDAGALTDEETRTAGEFSDNILKLQAEADQITETVETEGVAKAKAEAQKILDSVKPKRGTGRGAAIKAKAAVEIEDIKTQIRALGEVGRVNDIFGVSAEGSYLIGRLGIAYIKSGVGTLVEVAENLRSSFPDLNITDRDVWEALIASNPKLKARLRTKAEKDVSQIKSMSRMLIEIDDMSQGIGRDPAAKREIVPEVQKLRKQLTKLRNEFYKADFDKAKLERAIDSVNRLQDLLDTGKKRIKKEPGKVPPELAEQRELARQLNRELDVNEELESVNRQLETGIYDPPKIREKKPIDPRLERKQIELARKKKELRQWMADAMPWGPRRVAREVASLMKSMKATADVSFTLRQNVWHPFKTLGIGQKAKYFAKAARGELTVDDKFFPSLHALLSDYSADQIRNSMVNGPNGFLYEKHGLAILDPHSVGNKDRSEIFQNNVIERSNRPGLRIWGAVMRASSRHAVTIGNLVRTSVFDQFLANNPNATDAELTAFADYANVSTGIGNLGRFGAVGDELQMTFFSPKFAVSRPQTILAPLKHRKLPRVRKAIARDMARNVGTGLLALTLADLAGFDVEWWDPDDPDWGRIRFGNTRWDIFGGFLQFARLIGRATKYPFRGEDASNLSPVEMASRSLSYKFSPIVTTTSELWTGETIIGKEVDAPDWITDVTGELIGKRVKTLVKVPISIVYEDIYDAVEDEGLLVGVAATVTTLPGIGTQTYQDSRTAAFKKIRMLQSRGQYAEASRYKYHWNEHNRNLPPSKREKSITKVGPKKSRK